MNEIISFLKKRRSVTAKKMLPGKVPDSDLKDILECALRFLIMAFSSMEIVVSKTI